MTKISIAMFSIIAMAGVASAQQAKGSAAAGAKVDAKAATGAVTGAAGAATGAAKVGATAAVKVEMPKPDPQVAATLKAMGARSNCKGTGMGGPDMKTEMKFKGTMTHKSDLDGWWIHDSFNGTMGEGKAAMKFKLEGYMTYDAKMGKWRSVAVMNDGGMMAGTADMADGKLESTSDSWNMGMKGMFREHGDMTDKKAGMHMWGEVSMDNGKTWNKVYDMTCK